VIECKNLYGDITVDSSGEFVRTVANKKEGVYSPITQGKRHLELIKQIRKSGKKNLLLKSMFEKHFYENYRSVVVLANSKTILDVKHAPAEIKKQVIRADQLTDYIKKVNAEPGAVEFSEKDMEELANFFLSSHQECKTDYLKKYREAVKLEKGTHTIENERPSTNETDVNPSIPQCPRCGAPMVKRRATKGENAGSEFWGCSRFPHCRGIIKIENGQNRCIDQRL
jgi:ssDNA-binding Zn-finger/Zn-ribbon topoisomerase 1